jgi:TRAP-type C4-dicarboxylate transport system permease small subunit
MRVFRGVVLFNAGLAALALMVMMLITCTDVALRAFGYPLTGALDLVEICAALTIAGALPYTTAHKGHVAIEFFSRKMPRWAQVGVDSLMRLMTSAMFAALALSSWQYGARLRSLGQVSTTLQAPIFWVPWYVSFSCLLTALVIAYHLIRPGKAMMTS